VQHQAGDGHGLIVGQVPVHGPVELADGDLAVDVVLSGTLLPAKGRIRVSAELVAAPAGDVWWSHVTDASPDGVLELHDDLAQRVLTALPLSTRDRRTPRARAGNEKAFELYLRGMQLRARISALAEHPNPARRVRFEVYVE